MKIQNNLNAINSMCSHSVQGVLCTGSALHSECYREISFGFEFYAKCTIANIAVNEVRDAFDVTINCLPDTQTDKTTDNNDCGT